MFCKPWRVCGKPDFPVTTQGTKHLFGTRIDLANNATLIDNENTVLHILNDQLVDLRHAGKIDFPLGDDGFDRNCALRE